MHVLCQNEKVFIETIDMEDELLNLFGASRLNKFELSETSYDILFFAIKVAM